MGEAADDAIDAMLNGGWDYSDEPSNWGRRRRATVVECGRCGAGDLRWGNAKGGDWVLNTKDGSRHQCFPPLPPGQISAILKSFE